MSTPLQELQSMSADTADFQTRMTVLADLACEISAILGQDPMQGLREALRMRRKSRAGRRSRSRGGRPGGRRGRGRRGNRGGGQFAEPDEPHMVQASVLTNTVYRVFVYGSQKFNVSV